MSDKQPFFAEGEWEQICKDSVNERRETLVFENNGGGITIRQDNPVLGDGPDWQTVILNRPRAIELALKILQLAKAGEGVTVLTGSVDMKKFIP